MNGSSQNLFSKLSVLKLIRIVLNELIFLCLLIIDSNNVNNILSRLPASRSGDAFLGRKL